MRIIISLFLLAGLAGCMQTSQQLAQQAADDHAACRRMAMPINECLASIRQSRANQAQIRAAILASPDPVPAPAYQPPPPPAWRPVCANANLIGC